MSQRNTAVPNKRSVSLHNSVTCGSGTNNWKGTAGDNQWATASNWSKGAVPVSGDAVCLASTFTNKITIGTLAAANQTIASLTSGAPLSMAVGPLTITGAASFSDLSITGGQITLSGTSSTTTLEHSGGTLNGSGTFSASGLITWSGGTEGGAGVTNANGGITMSGEPFLDTRTLNNVGTTTWNGLAFLMLNGSVFNNQKGAIWNHQNDSQIEFEGGTSPTFANAGTFQKSGGTSTTGGGISSSIVFNNTGSVQANSGILQVLGLGSCSTTCGGTWSVGSGVTLQLASAGTAALSGGISGAGTVNFGSSGTINLTGTYNVTGTTEATGVIANFVSPAKVTSVGKLMISNGTLNFSAGTPISTPSITQSGGTLTGTDTVTSTGTITWSGGTESGAGVTNANGGITMSGEPFLDTRTLNNVGTATWNGLAFLMLNGSVFNNPKGSIWNHQNDSQIEFEGGTSPTFANAGTFQKTGGTSTTGGGISSSIVFNNTGSVQANSGILQVLGLGSCSTTCGGTWSVGSGVTLQLASAGTAALSGGISGAGTVNFGSSGTINLTGTYNVTGTTEATGVTANFVSPGSVTSVGKLMISNGTVNFSTGKAITTTTLTQSAGTLSGGDTVTVTGATTWSGGTQSGAGVTNANGGMTISGEPFLDTRTINNAKTANWNGLAFLMLNGSTFNNQKGATWNHQNDSQIDFEGGNTPTFNNLGTFQKTGGTTTSGGGFGGSISFINKGTVIAKTGLLLLGSAYTQNLGSTLLQGGNISLSGTSPLTEQSGSVLGSGTITGDVINTAGLISPSLFSPKVTTGLLSISGSGAGSYTQGAGGIAQFNIAGPASNQIDELSISGAASLAGSAVLCLVNNYKPATGTKFTVMTYGSEAGSFSTVQFGWSLNVGTTSTVATYNGAPSDTLSPTALAFPSQLLKTTSPPMTVTLTNSGQATLTIASIALGGTNAADYKISSNTCGSTLTAGSKCTIDATFTPSALGSRSAAITITDNACGSPHVIPLTGKGTEITLAPSPANFGTQTVGTTSGPITVTLTNHATTSVKVSSAKITGTNAKDFKITGNTCSTVAAGSTCTVTMTFTPSAKGARTADLSVTDADKGSPQTDVLEGTGQ
jgi:hypothetical protein